MPAQQRGRFGTVRKLASGRYQVRYYGPDGRRHSAPRTFERKSDATKYLALVGARITREEWADPDHGRVLVGDRPGSVRRPSSSTAAYSTSM